MDKLHHGRIKIGFLATYSPLVACGATSLHSHSFICMSTSKPLFSQISKFYSVRFLSFIQSDFVSCSGTAG